MYIESGDGFHDFDLDFLRDLFALLDSRLEDLQKWTDDCFDPDQMGLFDEAEYVAGMGFVSCQRYLVSTYGQHDLAKDTALAVGPRHAGGETYARILNAAANYWKHVDEWDTGATIARHTNALNENQRRTIRIIESVTPWSDYTCANLLCELTPEFRLSDLIPTLEDWRELLDAARAG